jgi:hypothetical protein
MDFPLRDDLSIFFDTNGEADYDACESFPACSQKI